MNKNQNEKYRAIEAIEYKYGLPVFRCGLSHLVSCGIQMLQDTEGVEKCKVDIQTNTPSNAVMTADFQCAIIDCAIELSHIDIWDLFRYIQTDVEITDWNGQTAPGGDECPVCGGELQFNGDQSIEGDGTCVSWTCPECGATGKQWNDLVFSEHTDVRDANGNPVD